jgi:hypothetical protein
VAAQRPRTNGSNFADVLRYAGLIALPVGAAGSIGLMLRARQHPPKLLLVLFVLWVLAPFAMLALAGVFSTRWSPLTAATLHGTMVVIAVGSLVMYGAVVLSPPRPQPAFVFVIVPPASWLLTAVTVGIAALVSRRQSRRAGDL